MRERGRSPVAGDAERRRGQTAAGAPSGLTAGAEPPPPPTLGPPTGVQSFGGRGGRPAMMSSICSLSMVSHSSRALAIGTYPEPVNRSATAGATNQERAPIGKAAAAHTARIPPQPYCGTTTAGATITPSVRVAAMDGFGNTATSFTGAVTVTIGSNPASGTLSGTTTVAATAGVAVFSTLRIDQAGSGYTLAAEAGAVTGTTSAAFQITPGTATQLAFIVPQSTATAGATITPPIQVAARDALQPYGSRRTDEHRPARDLRPRRAGLVPETGEEEGPYAGRERLRERFLHPLVAHEESRELGRLR